MTGTRSQALERRFAELVAQRHPIFGAARDLARRDPRALPLTGWIAARDEDTAAARLGIYSHMYFARLRDSLREDFELVARLVPASTFDAIAAAYIERHPSRDPSLRHHGKHFAEFLRRAQEGRDSVVRELRLDAADLAALEWARIDAFDAPDASPLERGELLRLAPDAWSRLELRSVPSVGMIETRFKVSSLWSALERGSAPDPPRIGPERILVWRRGHRVHHREIAGQEAEAMRRLQAGAGFPSLCACFVSTGLSDDHVARRAFVKIEQWLADEILAGRAECAPARRDDSEGPSNELDPFVDAATRRGL
jgi:hypothetical protein